MLPMLANHPRGSLYPVSTERYTKAGTIEIPAKSNALPWFQSGGFAKVIIIDIHRIGDSNEDS
ncbi:MAG: hypothetical protein BWY93_00192 [Euryarchaeota archaeon ADurb.BinA087]|nr:MAG: hypothetical protein BWY93_00192 [Euryarchaeota archaeon ADurb.BinA087]